MLYLFWPTWRKAMAIPTPPNVTAWPFKYDPKPSTHPFWFTVVVLLTRLQLIIPAAPELIWQQLPGKSNGVGSPFASLIVRLLNDGFFSLVSFFSVTGGATVVVVIVVGFVSEVAGFSVVEVVLLIKSVDTEEPDIFQSVGPSAPQHLN